MKLLMISGDRSILQGKKGAFYYTLEEFSKHWDRIDIITPFARDAHTPSPFPNVHFHPSPRGLWYQPWWILIKGDELIKEHHHNVMTVHEYPPFYNGLGARWLHNATKIPYMTEIHHIVGHPKAANLTEWIGYWMSRVWIPRWGTSRSAAVRVVSPEVQNALVDWGVPKERIIFLSSLYLDHEMLRRYPGIKKQYDAVFCARLVANKGLLNVLRAIALLPRVTLLVIGDGPERTRWENLAKNLGVANRVTFVGWIPEAFIAYREIQSAKVFIMNSLSEGGPRVLFETMALGMPVIATNVGLVPQVLKDGENGLLTTGTSSDVAAKITMLLDDESLRTRLGERARDVLQHFERGKLVREYADYLKTLICVS